MSELALPPDLPYCTPLGDDCGPTNSRSNWRNRGEPLVVLPLLLLDPHGLLLFVPSEDPLPLVSFPLGARPVDRSASSRVLHVLAGGSPLGKRWDQEEGRGWCTRDLLIGIPDSIRKTCRRDFFLMATTFLRSLSYLVTRRPIREGNRVVLFSRVLNSRRWCFPFLV